MKIISILCLLPLSACGMSENLLAAIGVGANVGSVAVIHRSPPDAIYSLVTGKDCSVVRLDQGKSYCRPPEPPPDPQPFCTRSLGRVDCWKDPAALAGSYRGVGEAPALTAEQEANRTHTSWP